MITIRKNGIIIACLGVLLVAAGLLNYYLGRPGEKTVETGGLLAASATQAPNGDQRASAAQGQDSIGVFAEQREQTRADEIAYLDSIIGSDKTDPQTLKLAQEEKLKIVGKMELEMKIEGLLAAKGFARNIVSCGETSISVVVDAGTLSEVEVAQILDIVRRESGEPAENIKIIPVVS